MDCLDKYEGNKEDAAHALSIDLATLYRKMKKFKEIISELKHLVAGKIKKFRRSVKAISPVISVLLMSAPSASILLKAISLLAAVRDETASATT